jgi:imidazolonepropionase-like amidohydrolase
MPPRHCEPSANIRPRTATSQRDLPQFAREFAVYVSYGMRPVDASRTATVNAADLLGPERPRHHRSGRAGRSIAVRGNPLEDVRLLERVAWVMKGGEVVR